MNNEVYKKEKEYETTVNLICAILDECTENGFRKRKSVDAKLKSVLNYYCYRQAEMPWIVKNIGNTQYIIIAGAYNLTNFKNGLLYDALSYIPEIKYSKTEYWDIIFNVNITKNKKCAVITLINPVFNLNQKREINTIALNPSKYFTKYKNEKLC